MVGVCSVQCTGDGGGGGRWWVYSAVPSPSPPLVPSSEESRNHDSWVSLQPAARLGSHPELRGENEGTTRKVDNYYRDIILIVLGNFDN